MEHADTEDEEQDGSLRDREQGKGQLARFAGWLSGCLLSPQSQDGRYMDDVPSKTWDVPAAVTSCFFKADPSTLVHCRRRAEDVGHLLRAELPNQRELISSNSSSLGLLPPD